MKQIRWGFLEGFRDWRFGGLGGRVVRIRGTYCWFQNNGMIAAYDHEGD